MGNTRRVTTEEEGVKIGDPRGSAKGQVVAKRHQAAESSWLVGKKRESWRGTGTGKNVPRGGVIETSPIPARVDKSMEKQNKLDQQVMGLVGGSWYQPVIQRGG